MSLTIATSHQPALRRIVAPAVLRQFAAQRGVPHPERAVGYTRPHISTRTGLLYFPRRPDGQFKFGSGTLPISLAQEVLLSGRLTRCERKVVYAHEAGHVRDNIRVLGDLERLLRTDPVFKSWLIDCRPFRKKDFGQVRQFIINRVLAIFLDQELRAIRRRDTPTEYRRLNRVVRTCRTRVRR